MGGCEVRHRGLTNCSQVQTSLSRSHLRLTIQVPNPSALFEPLLMQARLKQWMILPDRRIVSYARKLHQGWRALQKAVLQNENYRECARSLGRGQRVNLAPELREQFLAMKKWLWGKSEIKVLESPSKRWQNTFTMAGSHGSAEAATTSVASIKAASQTVLGSAPGNAERPISASDTRRMHEPRRC